MASLLPNFTHKFFLLHLVFLGALRSKSSLQTSQCHSKGRWFWLTDYIYHNNSSFPLLIFLRFPPWSWKPLITVLFCVFFCFCFFPSERLEKGVVDMLSFFVLNNLQDMTDVWFLPDTWRQPKGILQNSVNESIYCIKVNLLFDSYTYTFKLLPLTEARLKICF